MFSVVVLGFVMRVLWEGVVASAKIMSQCMRALVKLPQSVTVVFLCAGFEQEDLLLNKS